MLFKNEIIVYFLLLLFYRNFKTLLGSQVLAFFALNSKFFPLLFLLYPISWNCQYCYCIPACLYANVVTLFYFTKELKDFFW